MHPGFLKQLSAMIKSSEELERAGDNLTKMEPGMRSKLLREEKDMSEMDGLGYTEEEIEANVAKQMENNPHRVAWKKAKDKLGEAAKGG